MKDNSWMPSKLLTNAKDYHPDLAKKLENVNERLADGSVCAEPHRVTEVRIKLSRDPLIKDAVLDAISMGSATTLGVNPTFYSNMIERALEHEFFDDGKVHEVVYQILAQSTRKELPGGISYKSGESLSWAASIEAPEGKEQG